MSNEYGAQNEQKKLKVFISYSHLDNQPEKPNIDNFKKHLALLKNNNLINEWYDRYLLGGADFRKEIGQNLEKSDIICLFISANFLASSECMNEKKKAFALRKIKGIPVVPIIVSSCAWQDDPELPHVLAYPDDGKPISTYSDSNEAWLTIYQGIKGIVEKELIIKQLTIKAEFTSFLCKTDLLEKAHLQKDSITLKDIYIETELEKTDLLKKNIGIIRTNELIDNIFSYKKIIIAGEDQSGRTTLCKRIFCKLRKLNFIPVYISTEDIISHGKIDNIINKSIRKQYNNFNENVINPERIVPIVDDFQYSNDKEKRVNALIKYPLCVIITDDILGLNLKDKNLLSSFITFKMKELKPSIRSQLIRKWLSLDNKEADGDNYKELDAKIEQIDTTLGRNIGNGLIPAYPFFILSTLLTYETFSISLDQNITSQGYCYQAFLVYYLRRHNVKGNEVDIYFNFMEELASFMRRKNQKQLSYNDFSVFMTEYLEKFNLPIKPETLLKNLSEILLQDSLNNYSFKFSCFYYFFVSKSLSKNLDSPEVMSSIKDILNNLHIPENAYIAVFLIHHSKDICLFNEIEEVSATLFNKYDPATLTKSEMSFFDDEIHNVIKAVLPPDNETAEMHRDQLLTFKDDLEQNHEAEIKDEQISESEMFLLELRKAIKTVEVMGCIIRNHAGSLEKERLRNIFLDGMNVHLRILSTLIETMKSDEAQNATVEYITKKLNQLDESKDHYQKLSDEEKRKLARVILWNMFFVIVYGNVIKIIRSLGSDQLIEISNYVCENDENPAKTLVKYGIIMQYLKNIPIDEFHMKVTQSDFSSIAERSAVQMIVSYCTLHNVRFRQRQQIVDTFHIERAKLT